MTSLERSCVGAASGDWIALASERDVRTGVQRIEARFAGHGYEPHRHDTYNVGRTLSGVQSFDYRGARRNSLPRKAIVLHSDEVHDGRAGTDEGFRYRMLYLEPALVRAALGERASSLPLVDGAVSGDPGLLGAIGAALDDLSRPLEPLELDQVVLEVFEAMLRLDPGARTSRLGASARACARAVETARELLATEATRRVDSAELERATGLERHVLARQFRQRLGTSPYRYLTLRRLERARARIGAGDALGDAAIACGFADQSHMTRAFGRAHGVSPGRWRRSIGAANSAGTSRFAAAEP